ncbi:uncharacterized protein KIAA1143 homolog isoform X2 [Branchiostoma lanceolatum]|uniref:uncharacterized protein KIAA1143 homolog isoform X2 n=1 Tax=Branchiostoma lanceolatum TaxID=7740 RepID=UPI003454E654
MAGRGRHGVSFSKPSEPSFIRQFKERVGYKEGPDINTKKAAEKPSEEEEEDVRDDREDEKPTVVVLGTGDLTQEEADRWGEEKEKKDEETAIAEGKITFKKPVKRSAEEKSNLDASTSTKKRKDDKSDKKSKMKKVKNSSLLSFGDDEEEEDG